MKRNEITNYEKDTQKNNNSDTYIRAQTSSKIVMIVYTLLE